MEINFVVRRAELADASDMARVHVDTWRETYRGLMSDAVLDDPGLLARRETFWTAVLSDPRYSANNVAVATHEGSVVGIAMASPTLVDSDEPQELHLLYSYADVHGSGVGRALLNAVIEPGAPAVLWVADPNPRAQAFYKKNGFAPDGTSQVEDGVRDIRMVRGAGT
ncbi:N-acetyltransferase family protein [Pseudarthrobacter sp. J1738]|uniref:GNAT family N-acetyltransferase n=1 Tax=unclassified Pseudarthrobacter TaxID=2647000 RepID=UPI003D29CA34